MPKQSITDGDVLDHQVSDRLPLGLPALFEELAAQGIPPAQICAAAGVALTSDASTGQAIVVEDLPAVFAAARKLATHPDTALNAGQRQRIGNFGVFGFALVTSRTFADAFRFGLENLDLAGAVMTIDFVREGDVGMLRTQNPLALGSDLPFVAEFWRSSMTALMSEVLGHRFPSLAMYFPYRAPRNVATYRKVFGCTLHFGSDSMEWHFDARVLDEACPNADPLTFRVCQDFCDRIISGRGQSRLQRSVRSLCMTRASGALATAESIAHALGLSVRTLHRRLAEEGVAFKALLDQTRYSIASEYLINTSLSVEEISSRCGYGDAANFRKAFRRWSGLSPSHFRALSSDADRHLVPRGARTGAN